MGSVSAEDLEKYETEMELTLYKEYRDIVSQFSFVVETERRFYLANSVDVAARNADGEIYFEVRMSDAWVWDMYRPARFVKNVRVLTFKDVNVEEPTAGTAGRAKGRSVLGTIPGVRHAPAVADRYSGRACRSRAPELSQEGRPHSSRFAVRVRPAIVDVMAARTSWAAAARSGGADWRQPRAGCALPEKWRVATGARRRGDGRRGGLGCRGQDPPGTRSESPPRQTAAGGHDRGVTQPGWPRTSPVWRSGSTCPC